MKSASTTHLTRLLLTPSEVATALGVSLTRTYDLLRQQIVPSVRLGRSIRVARQDLEVFLSVGGSSRPPRSRNGKPRGAR